MGRLKMKNVHAKKDGRVYYRVKEKGRDYYVRLPALDDPTFSIELERVRNRSERALPTKGTIAALVADFRASSAFGDIPSAQTKRNYRRYLDMFAREDGHRTVKGIKPAFVRKMRDRYQEHPGKANNWLSIFKTLMDYAAENEWRDDNPAARIKPLRIGEHEPWPAEVLEKALEAATPMIRLAIVLGACTGVRRGDAIRLQHGWHDGRTLQFQASKNKTDVAIPMHPLLIEEMARVPRKALTILYGRDGNPIRRPDALSDRVRALMQSIGEDGYSFHGLRKNAACYLKELNLNDAEIGSMLAMTPDTVRHYTKRSRALMIARGAADRITKGDVLQLKVGRRERGA